jgi:hypothetical protein
MEKIHHWCRMNSRTHSTSPDGETTHHIEKRLRIQECELAVGFVDWKKQDVRCE